MYSNTSIHFSPVGMGAVLSPHLVLECMLYLVAIDACLFCLYVGPMHSQLESLSDSWARLKHSRDWLCNSSYSFESDFDRSHLQYGGYKLMILNCSTPSTFPNWPWHSAVNKNSVFSSFYVCMYVSIYLSVYLSSIYLPSTDVNSWILIFWIIYSTFLYLIEIAPYLASGSPQAAYCVFVTCLNQFSFLEYFLTFWHKLFPAHLVPTLPQSLIQLFLRGGMIPFSSIAFVTSMQLFGERGK